MVEKKRGGVLQQLFRVGASWRQSALRIECFTNHRRGFSRSHRPLRNRIEKAGDAVYELMTQTAKLL